MDIDNSIDFAIQNALNDFEIFEFSIDNLKFKLVPSKCKTDKYDVKYTLFEYGELTQKWYKCIIISPFFFFTKNQFSFETLKEQIILRLGNHNTRTIVFKEKYGDVVYDASTSESLGLACLKVLEERYYNSYYSISHELSYLESKKPTQDPSTITDLRLKEEYNKIYNSYINNIRIHNEEKEFIELTKNALKNLDLYLAYSLLQRRIYHEYESFEIVNINKVGVEFLQNIKA